MKSSETRDEIADAGAADEERAHGRLAALVRRAVRRDAPAPEELRARLRALVRENRPER